MSGQEDPPISATAAVEGGLEPTEAKDEAKDGDTDAGVIKRDPNELLEEGKRFQALQQYGQAAESFSQAVEILTAQFGELAPELIDALILYGRALLRNAVAQSAVLGGGPAGGDTPAEDAAPVAEGSTSAAAPAQPVLSALAGSSKPEAPVASGPNFHFGGDAPEDEEAAEEEEAEVVAEVDDDLENAWGILDTAKVILTRQEGDEAKLKLAGVYSALGEVATESEKFDDAVREYTSALELQKALFAEHDRRIAETYLMIALALEFSPGNETVEKAVTFAESAKAVLEKRLNHLVHSATGGRDDEAEIKDIKEVIVELDEKIEDLRNAPAVAAETEKDKRLNEFLSSQLPSTAPVNDLASMGLVKKKKPANGAANGTAEASSSKRKPEEADTESAKKPKLD